MAKKKAAAPAAPEAPKVEAPQVTGTEAQAPAAAAPAAPTEVKPPKPAKVEQNGVTRPGADTTTGKVWAFADSISASLKAPAPRADVMKACADSGINAATAATQYGKWRKFNGLKSEPKAPKVETPAAAPAAAPAAQ